MTPASAPKVWSMRWVSSVVTSPARSANWVSTSRAWRSNSAFTYSVLAAACSRSSTRAPISIGLDDELGEFLAGVLALAGQAHGALVGHREVLDAQAVADERDAVSEERGGSFHDGLVAPYAPYLTDRTDSPGRPAGGGPRHARRQTRARAVVYPRRRCWTACSSPPSSSGR